MVKRDFIAGIILATLIFIGFILLRIFVLAPYIVSESESNAFMHHDDYLMISKISQPDYKDFVVYTVDEKKYLGRVVAKENDSAIYMDDIFYLNNVVESDSYIDSLKADFQVQHPDTLFTDDFTLSSLTQSDISTIPKGSYLVLNDNRQNKSDSRQFGLITDQQIEGVVAFRILPLSQFGFLTTE
ncbi:signal peptidase I [Streptococcus caprae]|uniref:Signal peptidase I n=1 Tax=Streptococcus caprae TaxID=1640501 RepID=A0ABV8CVQ5_9STRE